MTTPDSEPPLPRQPHDPKNLARLREEARRRLDHEERSPAPAFGGAPPAPVYGGAPIVTRRWTLRGIVALVAAALAAVAAVVTRKWIASSHPGETSRPAATVYGGPPPPTPTPPVDSSGPPAPVYGAPPMPPPAPPDKP
jgi:hypothetical protein